MITFQKFCESIDELSTNNTIGEIFTQLNLIYQTKFLIYILQSVRNEIYSSNNQIIINYYNTIYSILTRRYNNIKNNEEVKQLPPNTPQFYSYKANLPDTEQLENINTGIWTDYLNNYLTNTENNTTYAVRVVDFVCTAAYATYITAYISRAIDYATIVNNTSTPQYTQFTYNLLRIQNNEMKTVNQIVQYSPNNNFDLDDLKVILDSLADQNYPHNDLIELLPNNRLRLKVFNIIGIDNNDIINQINNLPPDYQTIIFDTIKQIYSP